MYKTKIIKDKFDELVSFNSTDQTSYIEVSKNDPWRLIVILDNGKPEFAWEYVIEFNFTNLEILLEEYYIRTYQFMVVLGLNIMSDMCFVNLSLYCLSK